jgi:PAS domain S-box-containing protein
MIIVSVGVAQRLHESESQARLAAIVDSSEDAIVGKNLDGVITSWNSSATKIFGYSASEAIGQSITLIIPRDRLEEEKQILSRLRRGDSIRHFETVRRRKDGQLIDLSISVSPIKSEEGRIIGASKIARDITQQKKLIKERETLLNAEKEARQAAELANRSKDEFLAMLGHELRNPLHAITLAVQLLERKSTVDDGTAQTRSVIARQSQHLTRLVDDLLDVARITTGKMVLNRKPVNLEEVVSNCVVSLRETEQLKRHIFNVITEPAWVLGDPDRLSQIIVNLVGNALKYTPSGGNILLSTKTDKREAVVRVEDSGVGIEPTFLPKIFEPFVRGDVGLAGSPSGLGIGLAMVRRLVELHGGEVEAFSKGVDQGSSFVVRVPLIAAPEDEQKDDPLPTKPMSNRKRILVVEDNIDARTSLRGNLELMGHRVLEASDGLTAVQIALALEPDVALVDLGLPGLDGFEVAARVRGDRRGEKIRLVAITGYGLEEYRSKAMQVGFQEYVVKPINPEDLAALLADGRSVGA